MLMFHEPSLVLLALRYYTEIIDSPNFMINCKSLLIALKTPKRLEHFCFIVCSFVSIKNKIYVGEPFDK